ncbi:hypothetical protein JHK82_050327 [Glycine max]|nr:hypothetical protein JHK82_050327 [Glycine max]KAG5094643.1 hypothetical protein JHK84_050231 [Glycine max]
MKADIPLGWKPLNLQRYDGTIDPDKHLDAFLTQANLYTNDDTILCREMERRQEDELIKLKAYHDQLKACARPPHSDEQSAHALPEHP